MRRVKITKNSSIRKGAVFAGLTKKQILCGAIAVFTGLGVLGLGVGILQLPINLTMTLVFLDIVIVMAVGVVHINGMPLLEYLSLYFKGKDVRVYSSKGVLDSYVKKEKNT